MKNEKIVTTMQVMLARAMRLGMQMASEEHERWLDVKGERYEALLEEAKELAQSVENMVATVGADIQVAEVMPMVASMEEAWSYMAEAKD